MLYEDETKEFWSKYDHDDLVNRCAALHEQRRKLTEEKLSAEVMGSRYATSCIFLNGNGIELGAGDRPFPIPLTAKCSYGDIRDSAGLKKYFERDLIFVDRIIDAQTMHGVALSSLDFIISAHVIEHLLDPIGSVRVAIERLKIGGIFILVVPELTQTFDRRRPPTTLDHLIEDSKDGGILTNELAYIEHCTYVHPEITGEVFLDDEIIIQAKSAFDRHMDIHVHAWRKIDMLEMLDYISIKYNFIIEAHFSCVNENLFVLRRH